MTLGRCAINFNKLFMALKGNVREVVEREIGHFGCIITGTGVSAIVSNEIAHHENGMIQITGIDRNAEKRVDLSRQPGLFLKFSQGSLFGCFAELNKTTRQAPVPDFRSDASFYQQNSAGFINHHQASGRDGIFIDRFVALFTEKALMAVAYLFYEPDSTKWTICFFPHR